MHARISRTILITIVALCGCTTIPDGIEPVGNFDIERYLGTWHEIARLDHSFERGLERVSAQYSQLDDGGIQVLNRGYSPDSGSWDEAIGKAYFAGAPDVGHLKVSFFGPFYGGYNIIELDKTGYQYSLVAGPSRDYLWILARAPALEASTLQRLIDQADALGFPVHDRNTLRLGRAIHRDDGYAPTGGFDR